jgi:hypothetical protein
MRVIYLNKEQTEKVRGRHGIYSALEPVEADNGMFILPLEVLDDPEHKEVFTDLGECKYAEIDVIQVKDEKMPEEEKQILSVKIVSPVSITEEKEMTEKPKYQIIKGK